MKTLLLVTLFPLLAGCAGQAQLVRALAKDSATVALSVQTVYGTVYVVRTGNTNAQIIVGPISVK